MATFIPQRELRNNNATIIDRVEAGESFVVTRRGIAVADVIPHAERRTTPPMFAKTSELLESWQRDADPELDREGWLDDIRRADSVIDDDPLKDFAGLGDVASIIAV